MGVETVKIYCYDEQVVPELVDGVLVRVYDEAGAVFVTQGYTGDAGTGIVEFSLTGTPDPTPTNYTIRLSKLGVAFDGILGDESKSPQLISIYSPPLTTNNFDVYGNLFHHPVSSSPLLCRCSAYLFNADSTPADGAAVFLTSTYSPNLVGSTWGYAMAVNDIQINADSSGYVEVDLPRGGIYWVTVQGLVNTPLKIIVPDRDGFNLLHMLFPVVQSITYAPTSISLAVGETVEVVPTIVASDTQILVGAAPYDVTYAVADGSVATVAPSEDKLEIVGITAGSTTLSGSRADESVVFLPENPISQTPLSITVT